MQKTLLSLLFGSTLIALVAFADDAKALNADMEKKVRDRIVEIFQADGESVRVTWYDGKAVLTGKTKERATMKLAREVALSVDGVATVEDHLESYGESKYAGDKVKAQASDVHLEAAIRNRLGKQLGVNARDLDIEAADGVVTIRGFLADEPRKTIAMQVVHGVDGVTRLIDLVRLKP